MSYSSYSKVDTQDIPTDIQLVRKFQNAIQDQNIEKLMGLLSEFSPNVKTTRGGFRTPLSFACYYSRGLIVDILLSHGANPYILDPDNQSCLINYLSTRRLDVERDLPVISNIIARAPLLINLRSDRGVTPLYQAIAYDAPIEIIKLLIDLGADPNQNGPYHSVLLTAANNIIATAEDQTGILQNIYPNSRDILIYLIRNTDVTIPTLEEPFTRYPQIVELFDSERKRREYNKEFLEKGKKVAVLRKMKNLPPDSIDEIVKYMFRKTRKSIRKTRKSNNRKVSKKTSKKSLRKSTRKTRKSNNRKVSKKTPKKSLRKSTRNTRKSNKSNRKVSKKTSKKSIRKSVRKTRKSIRKNKK